MKQSELLNLIAERVIREHGDQPYIVTIDGVDAAGKSILAGELAEALRDRGILVSEASVDGYHNPRAVRMVRGRDSPEGFYRDSFNLGSLRKNLLDPFRAGGEYRLHMFDHRVDSPDPSMLYEFKPGTVLVFDGVFSLRPELRRYWDLTIYLSITEEESLRRGVERDPGDKDGLSSRYKVRYIPGQRLYKEEAKPEESADIIVDNNDPHNPLLV
ncbi:uridine kinase [Candidatus Bathyarchaeota archaeon]|nr:uridine kinase [Candidatus Bathyarchaeota archaeon]